MIRFTAALIAGLALLAGQDLGAQESVTRGRNIAVDVAQDGRLAIDLAGDIWVVPAGGGDAQRVTRSQQSAQRPRWSPDRMSIAYQAVSDGALGLWVHDMTTGESQSIGRDSSFDLHPAWHPDGQRLTYASDATGTGFDLWEVDLATRLHWRLSDRPGDETEPAWSSDGRDLVYVHRDGEKSSLILRPHGLPEETLLTTTDRLASPSWRPDGSLIMYFRTGPAGTSLNMAILSQPRLLRRYESAEQFVPAPVSWLDRHRMVYTANGLIRQRLFNSWTSSPLPFSATIVQEAPAAAIAVERRQLLSIDEPGGQLVIHASRLFDGLGAGYLSDRDIIIDGGRISAVEAHSDRPGATVIDMGDLAVMPGYIDARAHLPAEVSDSLGALLLTTGVTTIVARNDDEARLNTLWSGKVMPGPRLVDDDSDIAANASAIADSMTPGLPQLLQSRQARLVGSGEPVARRFAQAPSIDAGRTARVLGSRENGLPAGLGLHAELRALTAAGLTTDQSLHATGVNAAAALGLDPFLGRVAVGAVADLVFVDGDPLVDIEDALNVVAVVRNGRFFSVSGLIDRARAADCVE